MMRINDDDDHGDAHDDVGVGWSMKATSSSLLVRWAAIKRTLIHFLQHPQLPSYFFSSCNFMLLNVFFQDYTEICQSAPWSTSSSPQLPSFLHVFLRVITCISPSYYMYFCKMIHRFVRAHPDPFFPATRNFLHFFLFHILPGSFFAAGLYPPFLATAYTVYGLCGGALKSA